jgi:hypothetical protein
LKDNQRIIYQLTKIGIKNAIKRCLPMKEILETYLNNDYIEEESDNSENEYVKVKDLLEKDNRRDDGGIMKIIDTTESISEDITKLETNVNDLSALIFNRNIYDTLDGKSLSSEVKKVEPIKVVPEINNVINLNHDAPKEDDKNDHNDKESDNEIKIQKSEIKHSDVKRSEQKNNEDDEIIAQKYIEEKEKRDAENAKQLEEQFLAHSKSKNVKANILLDAIQVISKDTAPKKEQKKRSDDKMSIGKKQHSHSIDENDNFFEEMI